MLSQSEIDIYESLARLCDQTAESEFAYDASGIGNKGYIVARQLANAIRGRLRAEESKEN